MACALATLEGSKVFMLQDLNGVFIYLNKTEMLIATGFAVGGASVIAKKGPKPTKKEHRRFIEEMTAPHVRPMNLTLRRAMVWRDSDRIDESSTTSESDADAVLLVRNPL